MQLCSHSDGMIPTNAVFDQSNPGLGVGYAFYCKGALLKDWCLLMFVDVYRKLLPKYQEQHRDACL